MFFNVFLFYVFQCFSMFSKFERKQILNTCCDSGFFFQQAHILKVYSRFPHVCLKPTDPQFKLLFHFPLIVSSLFVFHAKVLPPQICHRSFMTPPKGPRIFLTGLKILCVTHHSCSPGSCRWGHVRGGVVRR